MMAAMVRVSSRMMMGMRNGRYSIIFSLVMLMTSYEISKFAHNILIPGLLMK